MQKYGKQNIVPQVLPEKHDYWTDSGLSWRKKNKNRDKKIPDNASVIHLIDEYRPEHQAALSTALEVADHNGDLVIVTSNYPDPFALFETQGQEKTAEQILMEDMASRANPEAFDQQNARAANNANAIAGSLRSRIASHVRMIEFTGPDQRPDNSFWSQ
jgi:hypothetical protein